MATDTFKHMAENQAGHLALELALQVVIQDIGTLNKLNNRAVAVKRKTDDFEKEPNPFTQVVKPQPSNDPSTPPQANTSNFHRKGLMGKLLRSHGRAPQREIQ